MFAMIRLPAFGARRVATVLVVLAALFHVQWLAACDVMPMADHGGHCVQAQAGDMDHCGDTAGAIGCQLMFVETTASLKSFERVQDADELPDAASWTGIPSFRVLRPAARPPDALHDAVTPDGRSLYLTSSRLRL